MINQQANSRTPFLAARVPKAGNSCKLLSLIWLWPDGGLCQPLSFSPTGCGDECVLPALSLSCALRYILSIEFSQIPWNKCALHFTLKKQTTKKLRITCLRFLTNKGLSQFQKGVHWMTRGKTGNTSSWKLLHGKSCSKKQDSLYKYSALFQWET